MSQTRKSNSPPSYRMIEDQKQIDSLVREVTRMKPKVEVTLAGGKEIAHGTIVAWFPKRNFFAVTFTQKTEHFDELIEAEPGLRVFFKANLFSTPLVFKTYSLRRPSKSEVHFRIPEQMYQQQQRGALRVPLVNIKATLTTEIAGEVEILDLSVGGAKLRFPGTSSPSVIKNLQVGGLLQASGLKLTRKKLNIPDLEIRITSSHTNKNADESVRDIIVGCRFSGMSPHHKEEIKQFLVEALKVYYEGVTKDNP